VGGGGGSGFAGRLYDQALLAALPPGIDPCGEYGEFHTFVHDGPIFRWPVAVQVGEVVARDGRYYADLLPAGAPAASQDQAPRIPPV
jgi:diphthamide synthase (EF-2-diphthine--ammonia ligase)